MHWLPAGAGESAPASCARWWRAAATLEALAADLSSSGAQVFCATADVARRESVDAAFAAARTRFGPVEILVNNAGQAVSAPITKRDEALWERLLAVNLSGTYFGIQ